MRVFEVMSEDVTTVPPAMPAEEARALMQSDRVHHLVVTANRRVLGVLSTGDLRGAVPAGASVRDVMTSHVVTVDRDETVRKAANLMDGRTIGCLPVTEDGRLVGIVTIADLLRLIGKGIDRPEPKRRRIANHRVPHRKTHMPSGTW